MLKPTRKLKVKWLFEPRDVWIGVYWKYHSIGKIRHYEFYVCILPMLPVHITYIVVSRRPYAGARKE